MSLESAVKADVVKVEKVLDLVGRDAEKGLLFAQKYSVPIEAIVAIAFPAAAPGVTATFNAVGLVQNAVLLVKQKYATEPAGTSAVQILQDELALVEPAVTSLLKSEGITYNTSQVEGLINLVVAAINSKALPVTA